VKKGRTDTPINETYPHQKRQQREPLQPIQVGVGLISKIPPGHFTDKSPKEEVGKVGVCVDVLIKKPVFIVVLAVLSG
jgi:hypothetical protein